MLAIVPSAMLHYHNLNIANIISLIRLFSVPIIVSFLLDEKYPLAVYLTLAVAISDGLDGFLARLFKCQTTLGRYLDPIADKALLVSLYITLAIKGFVPLWLTIAVVSRDALIVTGILVGQLMGQPFKVRPILLSKINTFFQLITLLFVMFFFLLDIEAITASPWIALWTAWGYKILCGITLATTILSGLAYTFLALKTKSITIK